MAQASGSEIIVSNNAIAALGFPHFQVFFFVELVVAGTSLAPSFAGSAAFVRLPLGIPSA